MAKRPTGRFYYFCLFAVLLFVGAACGSEQEHRLSGRTMGTTWAVAVVSERSVDVAGLQARIERRLAAVNAAMSTYLPDSEISRFNAIRAPGVPVTIGTEFGTVLTVARRLYRMTQGAFDPTVKPLVDLWGFGNAAPLRTPPSKTAISEARGRVGFHHVNMRGNSLSKRNGGVTINLAAIAKGYGVDAVAEEIRAAGFNRYLVEIGGEVAAAGRRSDGQPWRVGISDPLAIAETNRVYQALWLSDRTMATSGDYRQFFEVDGKRYSHVIDPRTGWPVANGVVSVTVLAPSCTEADALATAVMVMGPETGLMLISRLADVEAMIIVADSKGGLINVYSPGFPRGQ